MIRMGGLPAGAGGAWAGRSRSAMAAALVGLLFWLYLAFLRQVAGPLNPDEVYFSHTLWLMGQGKRQYIDFYSHHLPAYFALLKPFVAGMSSSPADLSYLWGLRVLSGIIIASYMGLAWALHRGAAPHTGRTGLVAACALLLVFVVFARMVEVRSDTIGLLLVNTAWVIVLCAWTRPRMLAAALLAGLAILFSARAFGMVGLLGVCLLALAARSRDWGGVRALAAVAGGFVASAFAVYLAAPDWAATVMRACFVEPVKLPSLVPMLHRFLLPERFALTLLIVGGLLYGLRMARTGQTERGWMIAAACGGQLLMLVIDPNPFEYVYGWAAVPAVLGVLNAGRFVAAYFPAGVAAALVGVSIVYTVAKGHLPPTGSPYRLTFDTVLDHAELDRLPTPELVGVMVGDKRQKNLESQLRVRSAVCRRLQGPVISTWDAHPVCLDDGLRDWPGLRWPALVEGQVLAQGAMPAQEFEALFMKARPKAFIWAHRWESPRPLLPATRRLLACCYDIYDGFAIAKEVPQGK